MSCGNSTRGGSGTGEGSLSKTGLSIKGRDQGGGGEDAIKLFSQVLLVCFYLRSFSFKMFFYIDWSPLRHYLCSS